MNSLFRFPTHFAGLVLISTMAFTQAENDPYETTNVYNEYPELVNEFKNQLRAYINNGRTRPLE
jgi:hypothetical protein